MGAPTGLRPDTVRPSHLAAARWVFVASGELTALRDQVVVRPLPGVTQTRGGVHVAPLAERHVKECLGWVTSVGPDRDDLIPGAVVLYRAFAGTEIQVGDQQRVILPAEDLLAVIEP
jgi:co-chaperonin GroES (HSP10)